MVNKTQNKGSTIAIVIFSLFILSSLVAVFIGANSDMSGAKEKILVIPLRSTIVTETSGSLFKSEGTSSSEIISLIDKAEEDPDIAGVIFEIDSPGGSPVGSHEIVKKIKSMTKPKISVIRSAGASGAYWVASATDYIIADELSLTGSVGVFGSYLEFSGLLDDYNVTYQRIVAGEYKDIGSPFKELTPDERFELERKVTMMQEFFLDDVTNNRNLTRNQVAQIKSGIYYLGLESVELGLIDELGGTPQAKEYFKNILDSDVTLIKISNKKGLFDILGSVFSNNNYLFGREISSSNIPSIEFK